MNEFQKHHPNFRYHLTNFFGVLLVYGVFVYMFSYVGGEATDYGMGMGANSSFGGHVDLNHGLQIMGGISGFVIAYMVTKNFKNGTT